METVSYEEMEQLAHILVKKIKDEFSIKKLSGNLANTIEVHASDDKIEVVIPAQTYNMLLYQTKKVVLHTSHGSYASDLDENGSEFFVYPNGTRKGSKKISPGNHKGFVDKVINEAIKEWLIAMGNKYREKRRIDTGAAQ